MRKKLQDQKKDKRGQMNLGDAPGMVVTLVVIALIVATLSIILDDFQAAQGSQNCPDGFDFNSSNTLCVNSTNSSNTQSPNTAVFNTTEDGLESMTNVSTQLPTVGTIIIAAILLGLIVTAFVFFTNRRT